MALALLSWDLMFRNLARIAIVLGVFWVVAHVWPGRAIQHGPGVLVDREPLQTTITPMPLPTIHGYGIQAVAMYDITSRILRTKHYWMGFGSDLAPIDVAVGWGRMSDQAVLDQLTISQGNRFFFYRWQNAPPLPQVEMTAHAANMHLIAADSGVAKAISSLCSGEVVTMRGYLVNVSRPDGSYWHTSLTRTDTGNGACELFYVQEIDRCEVSL